MSGVFSKPKMPPPPPPMEMPRTATVDDTQVERERGDIMRRRRGRAATILTSGAGDGGMGAAGSVATKSLLGQ
jgi:hypothetical protein